MSGKTVFLYLLLLMFTTYRLVSFCNGDISSCSNLKVKESNYFFSIKQNITNELLKLLPSPHRELLIGMTIGDDLFSYVPIFKQSLKDTGTIHVVVVSGFNITLVYNLIISVIGSPYKKRNLFICLGLTFLYAIFSGFKPPVIRSWIMGSILALGKFYGRRLPVLNVLVVSAIVMLIYNPVYLFSLSFHLSFLATLSLILFSEPISKLFGNTRNLLVQDLISTLSAQIMVLPYISYKFKTVSLLSPVVNMLVLWTVPIATILGSFLIVSLFFSSFLAKVLAGLVFLPLDFFVTIVDSFGRFRYASYAYGMSLGMVVLYFAFIFIIYKKWAT